MRQQRTIIRAFTAQGYHLDIAVLDGRELRMNVQGVEAGRDGLAIKPAAFPEMVRFEIVIEPPPT